MITASTDFYLRIPNFARGMILTGEVRSNRVETCHSATLSTNSVTGTDLRLLSDERTVFKSCVPTAQSTQRVSAEKKQQLLMLFREIIAVYSKNRTKHTNARFGKKYIQGVSKRALQL